MLNGLSEATKKLVLGCVTFINFRVVTKIMEGQNIDEDLEKVWVDSPISDGEAIVYGLTGHKPERPIEMTYGEYKAGRNIERVMVAGLMITIAVALYSSAMQEHGSLSKAYDAFMQQVDKWPAEMYNP